MENPYQTTTVPDETSDSPPPDSNGTQTPSAADGIWYLLLLPISFLYSFAAREMAGPGYTTSLNQGAIVIFYLAAILWPILSLVILSILKAVYRIRGSHAHSIGVISWALSCPVPFWIGIK